eukprot:TRINITY_DN3000_c0_g1_i5.p1 TRINITY_DN3000_c0_g1~~TRINITY_DN3000_c0_g1_i5.p1  ORF type:complete len:541 (+),score=152.60 TRINITY_DN3000_c0_g1_i5:294-1916(+)
MKVQKLQSEVHIGGRPDDTVSAQVMLHPSSFGPTEMPLLEGFFVNSNSLLPVVAHTTAEAFRHHIETPGTSYQSTSARSALYNGVVALSILLQLPENPSTSKDPSVVNRANAAISPYFQLANNAMKETFASPSSDAISALLVLSNCHQLMNDSQTSFLYTTYATAMCGQLRNCPTVLKTSCKFLADVRATSAAQLTPIEPFGGMDPVSFHDVTDPHARFLEIMAHVMVLLRAQHCPMSRQRVQEMYGSSRHILALIEEAELLTEQHKKLPASARFWVAAAQARFKVVEALQTGTNNMSTPVAAYTGVIGMVAADPKILRDPYAVYVCYSLTWIVLDLPDHQREQFPSFTSSLSRLAQVWPLAEAMVQILQVDTNVLEKPTLCAMLAKKASLSLEAPPMCMQKARDEPHPQPSAQMEVDPQFDPRPAKRATPSQSSLETEFNAELLSEPRDNSSSSLGQDSSPETEMLTRLPEYGVPLFSEEETEMIADFILSNGALEGTSEDAQDPLTDKMSLEDFDFDIDHLDHILAAGGEGGDFLAVQ